MNKHFMELPFYGEEEPADQRVGQKRTSSYPPSTTAIQSSGILRTNSNNDTKSMPPLKKLRSIETLPTIRFLPKKNSVRPITNFRVKSGVSPPSSSSGALYNCMHILKHIYNRNPGTDYIIIITVDYIIIIITVDYIIIIIIIIITVDYNANTDE